MIVISPCGRLQAQIADRARDRAINEPGVVVTKEDLDSARRSVKQVDSLAESNRLRARANLILPALSSVCDHGQNPHDVWQSTLEPNGISEGEWDKVYLKQGSTPAGRQKIARQLVTTPDALASAQANMDVSRLAARRKPDAAVDQALAGKDSTFRNCLEHRDRLLADPDPHHHWMPLNEAKYSDQKRAEWWKSLTSRLDVTLNDASRVHSCGLDATGVKVQTQ